MASAQEQLYETKEYDYSSPMTFEEWQDKKIGEYYNTGSFWGDFWKGFTEWPRLLNKNDKYIGRDAYNDYVSDFRDKQGTYNAGVSEFNQRSHDDYMTTHANQIAYKDLEATGLNPALLLTSAFGPASTHTSASAFNRNSNSSNSKSESHNRSSSASAVLAALIYMLARVI